MNAINETRLRVWEKQPVAFLDEAIIDADGTVAKTDAECKQGVDIAYNGLWGYQVFFGFAGQYGRIRVPAQSRRQSPVAGAGQRVELSHDRPPQSAGDRHGRPASGHRQSRQ
jgi:hypothetical protein